MIFVSCDVPRAERKRGRCVELCYCQLLYSGCLVSNLFSGVVLLVEDDPLVRMVTADILLDADFRVIEAANADEALTVLSAGVEVDVLLSDVDMPPG
ncbi:response regulator, partial [Klebsiella pneumoniae]|nr:response regulator [Klebsiella pneumoniae]